MDSLKALDPKRPIREADIDGDRHIGRIMLHSQPPEGQPWFWTITARQAKPSIYNRYAPSREQAMAAARWAMRDG